MKAIEFELDYTLAETGYFCTCCNNTEIDHSGPYYPTKEVNRLVEAASFACRCRPVDHVKAFEQIRAALAPWKEE